MVITGKGKYIFPILVIGIIVFMISSDNKEDKKGKIEVAKSNIVAKKSNFKSSIKVTDKVSPLLKKKIALAKQKIKEKQEIHNAFLQSRKNNFNKEIKRRSTYLSYRSKVESRDRVRRKFESVKKEKEDFYRKKLALSNGANVSNDRNSQGRKRIHLNKSRIKGINQIKKVQTLNQKYKQ